jgi:hypothetical protein
LSINKTGAGAIVESGEAAVFAAIRMQGAGIPGKKKGGKKSLLSR